MRNRRIVTRSKPAAAAMMSVCSVRPEVAAFLSSTVQLQRESAPNHCFLLCCSSWRIAADGSLRSGAVVVPLPPLLASQEGEHWSQHALVAAAAPQAQACTSLSARPVLRPRQRMNPFPYGCLRPHHLCLSAPSAAGQGTASFRLRMSSDSEGPSAGQRPSATSYKHTPRKH